MIKKTNTAALLTEWREEYTQKDFAKKIGLSVQNVNDIFQGRRTPSLKRAKKIAKKLKRDELDLKRLLEAILDDHLKSAGFTYKVQGLYT